MLALRLKVGTVCCNCPCWSQLGAEPHCRVTGTKWNVSGKRPEDCPLKTEPKNERK
jgi:hypothetical protein